MCSRIFHIFLFPVRQGTTPNLIHQSCIKFSSDAKVTCFSSFYSNKENLSSFITMNKYVLFQRLRDRLPQLHNKVVSYSMLDKPPTIDFPPEPLEIEDKPYHMDPKTNTSKAMKVYMDNVNKYNKFMAAQKDEYETGKRHLANMMGCDPETFTQKQIDDAITYLFPCGLFEKRARPLMKPPEEIFPPRKEAEFDVTGRPFHCLFYTLTPNFYQILHDYVKQMKELDNFEDKVISGEIAPPDDNRLALEASQWVSHNDLDKMCCEKLSEDQYKQFCQVMDRLTQHKYAKTAQDFIFKYRTMIKSSMSDRADLPILLDDGRQRITVEWNSFRHARAHVTVTFPGTGKIDIDGKNIDGFKDIRAREQIIFPLALTGLMNKVDIEATLPQPEGEIGNSGAIRLGISRAISHFVDADMKEKMKLAGLLQRELRRKERKKPGQEGARRKFTWRKR